MSAAGLDELRQDAIDIARGAGRILADVFGGVRQVHHKGPIDLVTDADQASERFVLDEIERRYPDHAVIAEEAGDARPGGPWRWVVDPLDGTTNFAHGFPHFAVLIAVQERLGDGRYATRLAVTLDPMRGELFVAERGRGASLNGVPARVSAARRLGDALLATGFAYDRLWSEADNHAEFCRLNLLTRGVRRCGSAGLDLAYVACGRLDGFWESGLRPWDMAGGVLLAVEAGGQATTPDGGALELASPSVVVSNGVIHDELRAALRSARAAPINAREGLAPFLSPELRARLPAPRS